MQLTTAERKLMERLRKRERKWPRDRWILLIGGGLICALYVAMLLGLLGRLDLETPDSTYVGLFLFIWPVCLIMCLFGTYFVVWAIAEWHGNPTRRMLLKLLDSHLDGDQENGA